MKKLKKPKEIKKCIKPKIKGKTLKKEKLKFDKRDLNIFKVQGKFNLFYLLLSLVITLGGAFIVSCFTKGSLGFYDTLKQPFFAPKPWVFSIVWGILYVLMAIAAYRILLLHKTGDRNYSKALLLYIIQLGLNFIWPIIFFNYRLVAVAFVELVLLLMILVLTIIEFFKADKTAGYLMMPYLLWTIFAGILNYALFFLNY